MINRRGFYRHPRLSPAGRRDAILGQVVELVGIPDLIAGVADLELDATGRPARTLVAVDLDRDDWSLVDDAVAALRRPSALVVGVGSRPLPEASAPLLDALTLTLAPSGPGRSWAGTAADLDTIAEVVHQNPVAATTFAWTLHATSSAAVVDGLVVESSTYSALLAGEEFRDWRARTPRGALGRESDLVALTRQDDVLEITLDRPRRHNAFSSALRDALIEALWIAECDTSVRRVRLAGNGPSFCSGGDLDEFGSVTDPAAAHLVRMSRSAGHAVHRIADRVEAHVHGACIGAGVEVPAFAGRLVAHEDAWFQLPELSMGLIPGAGGTVSIPRRIGRWRTAYLALTQARIDARTALAWGLVDALS